MKKRMSKRKARVKRKRMKMRIGSGGTQRREDKFRHGVHLHSSTLGSLRQVDNRLKASQTHIIRPMQSINKSMNTTRILVLRVLCSSFSACRKVKLLQGPVLTPA